MTQHRDRRSRRVREAIEPDVGAIDSLEATKLVDQAHDRLEELIVTLELAPGSRLTEQSLTRVLGIGRTPVREALQQLSAAHLVTIIPRHGIRVTPVNAHEYLLVLELRRELDRLIATRAARRAWPEERKRIGDYADVLMNAAKQDDAVTFLREQAASRQLIVAAARNEFVAAASKPLDSLSRRFFFYLHRAVGYDIRRAAEVHTDVLRAIAAGDADAAAAASDAQISFAESRARSLVEPEA